MIPKIEFLDKTKKKKLLNQLEECYGIEDMKYLLISSGKDKFRIFSGNLSKDELNELAKNIYIEMIGARLCTLAENNIRLNFDIMNLPEIKKQITKNVVEINDEQLLIWLKGGNPEVEPKIKAKFIAVKHNGDFIGIARNRETFLKNYVPKERRVK